MGLCVFSGYYLLNFGLFTWSCFGNFFFSKKVPKWYKNNQHVLLTVLCYSSHGGIRVGNFKFGKYTTTQSGKWLCSLSLGPSGLLWYIISMTVLMANCHCYCQCHHYCHWCWCCCYARLPFPDCQISARFLPDCCQIARLPDCQIAWLPDHMFKAWQWFVVHSSGQSVCWKNRVSSKLFNIWTRNKNNSPSDDILE